MILWQWLYRMVAYIYIYILCTNVRKTVWVIAMVVSQSRQQVHCNHTEQVYFLKILHNCGLKLQGHNYSLLILTSPSPWWWWHTISCTLSALQKYFHYNVIYHSTCNLGIVLSVIFVSLVYPSSTSRKVSRLLVKSSSLNPGTWR